MLCIILVATTLIIAAAPVHMESIGGFQVILYRFKDMNGLESSRYLLRQEIVSKYPGEVLNVDIDYKGRSLSKKLDYYYVIIDLGENWIRCLGIDNMNTSDPPYILWDTVIEVPAPFK